MRALIRTDASVEIGSGHVARCLHLADALCSRGFMVTFACRDLPGHAMDLIAQHGHACYRLPGDADTASDAATCTALVGTLDLLVVDHYALDADWERRLRGHCRVLLAIDDLADRPHDCDILLDGNLLGGLARRYAGLLPSHCALWLGPAYLLIDARFQNLPPRARRESSTPLRRLLIFFGGSDPGDMTGMALDSIARVAPGYAVDVICGAANTRWPAIQARCAARPTLWRGHRQTDRMPELMQTADLALGAGGSSHWERCLAGLPTLVVSIADNQVPVSRHLDALGACRYLGAQADLTPDRLDAALADALASPEITRAMGERARTLMPDGDSTARVADALLAACARPGRNADTNTAHTGETSHA